MFKDGKIDTKKFNSSQDDKNNELTTENTN